MTCPRPLLSAIAAALGLGLGLGACSEEAAPASAGAALRSDWPGILQPLELRAAEASALEPARTVARLFPPPEVEPWRATAQRAFYASVPAGPGEESVPGFARVEGQDAVPALVVTGDRRTPRSVHVPGPFDPRAFDQVVARLAVPEPEELRITLRRAGRELASSQPLVLRGAPLPQLAVFDLPGLWRAEERADELVLELAGRAQGAMVVELALVDQPLGAFLPPAGAPELVALHAESGERRRGVGLFGDAALEVELAVPAGAELAFSYGVPEALRLAAGEPQLHLQLEAPGGARSERSFELSGPGWSAALLDLREFEGQRVRARFATSAAGSEPAACMIAEPRLRRTAPEPPGVLLVTSDTHRGDHLGALGARPLVSTPALDALAARGVLFEDAWAASNTTNPSHVALMTGVHVRDTRVVDNHTPLLAAARTLAEEFSEAGWRTFAAVSVRHLDHDESGLGQGFERASAPRAAERRAAETVAELEAWLADAEGEPLFVWLHVFDAHSPYEPPAPYDRRYYTAGRDPFDPARRLQYTGRFLPLYLKGLTDVEFPHAQYRAEIDSLDAELGRVLARERFRGGVVAFTADHGESFGDHGVWWDHSGLYPDSLHVPLILAWPGAPRGARCDAPVRQMDLGRTLLELAGVPAGEHRGRDLRAFLAGRPDPTARYAIAKDGNSASLERDGWLFVLNLRDHHPTAMVAPRARHAVELYDLRGDPGAAEDRSARERERARRMRSELVAWLAQGGPGGLAGSSTTTLAQRARLAQLGYADDDGEPAGDASWIDPDCGCERCAELR